MWFGETLPVSKAGDSQDKALTLPVNPIFTHLLLGEICLPARMGGQSAAAMQPEAALGGGGEALRGNISGLWAAKPCLGAQRKRKGEEALSTGCPTHTPKGPPVWYTGWVSCRHFPWCWRCSRQGKDKVPLSQPVPAGSPQAVCGS